MGFSVNRNIKLGILLVVLLALFAGYRTAAPYFREDPYTTLVYADKHVDTTSPEYGRLLSEQVAAWGLGKKLEAYGSNDRSYAWYVDQGVTGTHANSNCGPASVAMAAKWYNERSKFTAEDARGAFRPLGGWWYFDDITGALDRFKVSYFTAEIARPEDLLKYIQNGRIVVVNNTMGGISRGGGGDSHVGRFYEFSSGHFLIVKGFAQVDGVLYFEVYDPNNWGMTYADGKPMGANRYYKGNELVNSVVSWFPTVVVIDKP